jgi:ribosomal protein L40E
MGLVNKLRRAFGGTDDRREETFVCDTCGAEFDTQRTACEKCGSMSISQSG